MQQTVSVRVPATSANMGPGFDCLGMALDIWNIVRVETGLSGFVIEGEGAAELPKGTSNLVYRCFGLAFAESGQPVPEARFTCDNNIPLGRGLGSSAAAAVGGLMAGNQLCERPLSQAHLLELAARTEGHPDNVAPALLGGCQVAVRDEDLIVTSRVPLPDDLHAVLFIPDVPMPTKEARSLLPPNVDRRDAVYNIGRVGLLVNALATGDLSQLVVATDDRLHQPARQAIFPPMKNIFRAAVAAGALGVFLSGAGSSVLALSRGREMSIGYEMAEAASKSGVGGEFIVTRPAARGAHVVESEQ